MPHHDPIAEFQELFAKAGKSEHDATACNLATADAEGRPSNRMVLLKGVDERGFVFYTNYASRKASQLTANPRAALCFHWQTVGLQIRVEGAVERLPPAESDTYFASRARDSRIGAWASKQSQPLASRAELLARVARFEAKFFGRKVPRPEFWGGYRLTPQRIEIWRNQLHRLHDRFLYRRRADGWTRERLFP